MTRMLFCVMVCVLSMVLCSTVYGGDWTGLAAAGDNQVDIWFTKQYDRVAIGPCFTWVDNDGMPEADGYGAGIVATYDLVDDATIVVGDTSIPARWSIGGKAEGMYLRGTHDFDPAPSLLTKLSLGSEKAGLSIIYEFRLSDNLWSALAPIEDEHNILFAGYVRF